jgi:predicted 3-demethylubiquinone-9 3-methyltransferase (glyoxalase superfamily)
LSWQIVPAEFFELISKGTPEQSDRVMAAMMKMVKMDLAKLKQAYNGD